MNGSYTPFLGIRAVIKPREILSNAYGIDLSEYIPPRFTNKSWATFALERATYVSPRTRNCVIGPYFSAYLLNKGITLPLAAASSKAFPSIGRPG